MTRTGEAGPDQIAGWAEAEPVRGAFPAMGHPAFPAIGHIVDLGAALVTAMLLLVAGFGLTGLPRVLLALVFVTFVPGWTVLNHVRLAEGTSRLALSVAFSLTLGTAATALSLWLHLWHPRGLLDVAAATCLFSLLWHLAGVGQRLGAEQARS